MRHAYKVVYNASYGGFGLSPAAEKWMKKHGVEDWRSIERHHPTLVRCVETLKDDANGKFASLSIATVHGPYKIDEYDGSEGVIEPEDLKWIDPTVIHKTKSIAEEKDGRSDEDIVIKTREAIVKVLGSYIDEADDVVRSIVRKYVVSGQDDPGHWSPDSPVIIHCDGTGIPSGEYDTRVFDLWFEVSDMIGPEYYIDRINHVVLCVSRDT